MRRWLPLVETVVIALFVVLPVTLALGFVTYTVMRDRGVPVLLATASVAWVSVWTAWATEAGWALWRRRFGITREPIVRINRGGVA